MIMLRNVYDHKSLSTKGSFVLKWVIKQKRLANQNLVQSLVVRKPLSVLKLVLLSLIPGWIAGSRIAPRIAPRITRARSLSWAAAPVSCCFSAIPPIGAVRGKVRAVAAARTASLLRAHFGDLIKTKG